MTPAEELAVIVSVIALRQRPRDYEGMSAQLAKRYEPSDVAGAMLLLEREGAAEPIDDMPSGAPPWIDTLLWDETPEDRERITALLARVILATTAHKIAERYEGAPIPWPLES